MPEPPHTKWPTDPLTEAPQAVARTKDTYLAAHHSQLRGRRGEPKAIGATRDDILIAYSYVVRHHPIPRARTWPRRRLVLAPEPNRHRAARDLDQPRLPSADA